VAASEAREATIHGGGRDGVGRDSGDGIERSAVTNATARGDSARWSLVATVGGWARG